MAQSVWHAKPDQQAFEDGRAAAESGQSRIPIKRYATYNERAAFNDGWDSVRRFGVSFEPVRPAPRRI